MRAEHDLIPETALNWIEAGKTAALATVVETWGSAPRPIGSQLAISSEAQIQGSVSGGCVESAVVAEALDALNDGTPRILEYGIADEDAFAVGLACGGTIRILVEPIGTGQGPEEALIRSLVARRAAHEATIYAINTTDWSRRLIVPDASGGPDPLAKPAALAAHRDRSGFDGDWFLSVHNPPLRLIAIGAVHIAQPLLKMARETGYAATLIDPRDAFAAAHRFPGETVLTEWPDEALEHLGIDARTAIAALTHDPKIDDPALMIALRSPAFYVGALGSTRTHAKRVDRLTQAGLGPDEMARLHAPIGANIGAQSPAEIAISILAQITERLRRPDTRP